MRTYFLHKMENLCGAGAALRAATGAGAGIIKKKRPVNGDGHMAAG